VGGTRYCRALPERRTHPYRYKLICRKCGQEYYRKRRVDTGRYVCGKCRGKLQIIQLDSPIKS
jgi:SprT-like protein